jgi:hypothetical protein
MHLNTPVVIGILLVVAAAALYGGTDTEASWILGLTAAGFGTMGYGVFFHKQDDHKSSGKISRHWDE